MKLITTPINDLFVIELDYFNDERGFFVESYNQRQFNSKLNYSFVQDNHSRSKYGVIRGLHFQGCKDFGQAKLVRCARGKVWDVAVDIRPNSQTYGKWFGTYLSDENFKMLMIPAGFAHGFVALSQEIDLIYKCDKFYDKEKESGLAWNDPTINIQWPIEEKDIILSDRDKCNPKFKL